MFIREIIEKDSPSEKASSAKGYSAVIPRTNVTFDMVPIPGGTFQIGTPTTEAGHQDDEGPQVLIRVEPFWMGKHEVTWAEYQQFMEL